MCDTVMRMALDRLSITVDAELGRAVREAAAAEGMSVSSWASEALAQRVRNHFLREALDAWEAEDGPITEEDRAEAKRILDEAEALARTRAERLAG